MGRTAKIVITTETGAIFNFEVDAAENIENVKALVEVEVRTLQSTIHFYPLAQFTRIHYITHSTPPASNQTPSERNISHLIP
jgi:hypothetical protein